MTILHCSHNNSALVRTITLWDVSSDSTSLGVTDIQRNTSFAQSGWFFTEIWDFQTGTLPTFVKMIIASYIADTISRFWCKNWSTLTQDMSKNVLRHVEANQTVKLKQFVIITWQYWVFLRTNFCVETMRFCLVFWVP